MNVKQFNANLKRQIEENPIAAVMVATSVVIVITKLVATTTEARNSKTWAKEVDRRRRMS